MASRAFGSAQGKKAHLLRAGGLAAEIADVRADAELAFESLESKTGYPTVSKMAGAGAGVSLAAVPVAATLTGSGFLQGAVAATLSLTEPSTSTLVLTANRPGTGGNAITLHIATGGGSLSVAVVGTAITVTLASGGSTVAAIVTAINASATAKLLVHASSTGSGTVIAAMAATPLAGGLGTDLSVKVNGVEQQVVGLATDTSIPLVVSNLTGYANTDLATVQATCNGIQANSVTFEVVT